MHYKPGRIFLSVPHMGGHEKNYVLKALEDNWVGTTGPNLPGFEHDVCQHTNARYAVALNSGTAALHLALLVAGVKASDEVICSTFTSIASANPILYLGAKPVFIDSEPETWNMAPTALRQAVEERLQAGKKAACILVTHAYGLPAKMKEILEIAAEFEIPVIEDAAEALGARYGGHQVGTLGRMGVFSFSGNNIVSTSGGGAVVTADETVAKEVLELATNATGLNSATDHERVGYNYRMSNISAGIGRGQMGVLEQRIKQRREVYTYYKEHLQTIEGIAFLPEPKVCFSNRWLTTLLLPDTHTPQSIKRTLEAENIETSLFWKPLHRQTLFKDAPYFGDDLSSRLFARGLCLPSSSSLTEEELQKVVKSLNNLLAPSG